MNSGFKDKWYVKFISFILIAFAFYFLYLSASKSYEQLKEFSFSDVNYLFLLLSIPFFISAVTYSGFAWLKLFKINYDLKNTVFMYMYIWGFKYIPGQIGTSLGKIEWGIIQGIDKKKTLAKILEEHIYIALSSVLLSVPLVFMLKDYVEFSPTLISTFFIAIILGSVLLYVGNRKFNIIKYFKDKNLGMHLFNFSVSRMLNGIGLIFVYLAIAKDVEISILYIPSIFILSSLIGLLSFFVPGGLGVREASMIFLLNYLVMPLESILIASFSRIMNIISDLITWLIGLIKYKKQ